MDSFVKQIIEQMNAQLQTTIDENLLPASALWFDDLPLPMPLFTAATEDSVPIAVVGSCIYLASMTEDGSETNCLFTPRRKRALFLAGTLGSAQLAFEEEFLRSDALDRWQTDYARLILGEAVSAAQLALQLAETRWLHFFATRMIPKLQAECSLRHRNGVNETVRSLADQPIALPSVLQGALASDAPTPGGSAETWRLDRVLSGDLLLMDGVVYALIEDRPQGQAALSSGVSVQIEGRTYIPILPGTALRKLEVVFRSQLAQELRAQALTDTPRRVSRMREVSDYRARLLAATRAAEGDYLYRDGEMGILSCGGDEPSHLIFREVEEYVLRDYHEPKALYRLDPVRVGVFVRAGEPLPHGPPLGAPVVIPADYEHPFVGGGVVCMGGRGGDAYDWSWWTAEVPLQTSIYKYLRDARSNLLTGYHEKNPHTATHELAKFAHRRISREEVRRRGLRVTNIEVNSQP